MGAPLGDTDGTTDGATVGVGVGAADGTSAADFGPPAQLYSLFEGLAASLRCFPFSSFFAFSRIKRFEESYVASHYSRRFEFSEENISKYCLICFFENVAEKQSKKISTSMFCNWW